MLIANNDSQKEKPSFTLLSFKGCFIGLCLLICLYCFGQLGYMILKAHTAQWLLERAWQKSQSLQFTATSYQDLTTIKPWPWADNFPVAKLSFPRFNHSFLVLNNDSGQALAFGPGLSGVSNINNEGSHFIFGHRDSHFKLLADVVIGDKITIELSSGKTRQYVINNLVVINIEHEQLIYPTLPYPKIESLDQGYSSQVYSAAIYSQGPQSTVSELNLITCYPFTSISPSTPLRLVVQASEVINRA